MHSWQERFFSYLRTQQMSCLRAAHDLRISPATVHTWKAKSVYPREVMRWKIELWSDGAVPADLPNKRTVEAA
jgi:hypothetical protein